MNIISTKKKPLLFNNNCSLVNDREKKLNKNNSELTYDNKKETTIYSTSYNFNNSLSNYVDNHQLRNISLNSIDDKYKYLENPFACPEIPKNEDEERREKIIRIINRNRNRNIRYKSQSVDNIRSKKSDIFLKRGNKSFGEEKGAYN